MLSTTSHTTFATAFPSGFFSSQKFAMLFTYDGATRDCAAYLVGSDGSSVHTYKYEAGQPAAETKLAFARANLFWPPEAANEVYLRRFRFWDHVLSQSQVQSVAAEAIA